MEICFLEENQKQECSSSFAIKCFQVHLKCVNKNEQNDKLNTLLVNSHNILFPSFWDAYCHERHNSDSLQVHKFFPDASKDNRTRRKCKWIYLKENLVHIPLSWKLKYGRWPRKHKTKQKNSHNILWVCFIRSSVLKPWYQISLDSQWEKSFGLCANNGKFKYMNSRSKLGRIKNKKAWDITKWCQRSSVAAFSRAFQEKRKKGKNSGENRNASKLWYCFSSNKNRGVWGGSSALLCMVGSAVKCWKFF